MIHENSQEQDTDIPRTYKELPMAESMETGVNKERETKTESDQQFLMQMMDPEPTEKKQTEEKSKISKGSLPKTKRNSVQLTEKEYFEILFKIPKENASKGRSVYIRPEFHKKFLKLIAGLEIKGLTIYAYIDNIIEHHFMQFEETIHRIYQDRNKPLF